MESIKRALQSERGIVLAISLLVLTLLLAGGMGALLSTQMDLNTSANLHSGRRAFYIAEAGLQQASRELDDSGGTIAFDRAFDRDGVTTMLRNIAFAGGSYTVTMERIPGSGPKRIRTAVVSCFPAADPCPAGHSKVIVEAHFRREPLFPCVLCAREGIALSGGVVTDSYDSRQGSYGESNSGSGGDLQSNGDIILSGIATVVKGTATAAGRVAADGGAVVAGSTTSNAPPAGFPRVASCGPPFSPGAGITGGSYNPSSGELRGVGSDAIILANGTYCLSSVELTDASTLVISGPVTLNLTAASHFTGGGIENQSANVESLRIISSYSSTSEGVTVLSGRSVHATLYAPNARVDVVGAGDFYGAIVGRTVVSTAGARFHYDRKLKVNEDGRIKMVFWKEAL